MSRLTPVALALLLGATAPARANFVAYSNNFQTNAAGFSNTSLTTLPTDGSSFAAPTATSQFLGRFASDTVFLTLTGLSAGTYTVGFDLFVGGSWDGNSTQFGPDGWLLTVTGGSPAALVNTTFINLVPADGLLNNFTQSYSDANLTTLGANPAFTGADVARTNVQEPGIISNRYAIYTFGSGRGNPTPSFTTAGGTVSLGFQGFGLQDVSDEFWAIDNVVVTGVSAVNAVPGPPTLVAAGLFAAGGLLLRRRR